MKKTYEILEQFNKLGKGLEITVTYHEKDDILEVFMDGYLDTINSEDFRSLLKELAENTKTSRIVFNLRKLSYISSMGIGFFISLVRDYSPTGKNIFFLGMSETVSGVFKTLGFLEFITRIESLKEINK